MTAEQRHKLIEVLKVELAHRGCVRDSTGLLRDCYQEDILAGVMKALEAVGAL